MWRPGLVCNNPTDDSYYYYYYANLYSATRCIVVHWASSPVAESDTLTVVVAKGIEETEREECLVVVY